jgi:beta-glucosidase
MATPTSDHDDRPGADDGDDLDARIRVLAGTDMWHTAALGDLPVIRMSDGPAGVRGTSWTGPASASFPCGTALAATFDPDLVREVGRALGREARSKHAHVLLAPTVNLHRTPVGGRNFECMSEDPVHTADMAVAYVEGVQSERVACCIKHFVGNDTEFARFVVSSEISERVLRELYLVPFEAAVGAGVRSIMTGYNRLNGTFCSEHEWLLTELLRGEWGFDGLVVSDWYGTHSGLPALRAGLDLEMPGPPIHRGAALRAELDVDGTPEDLAAIDATIGRLRALAEWTGAGDGATDETTADDPETRAVIRRAAAAAMVLLRNEGDLLPIAPTGTVALIGPYARTGRIQGGGSAKVRPDRPAPVLPALEARGLGVVFEPGCRIDKYVPTLHGRFELTVTDEQGHELVTSISRLEMVRQHHEHDGLVGDIAAHAVGTFVPEESGTWEFGLRAVDLATVRVNGEVVVEVTEVQRAGSFFGFGSDEVIGQVDLDGGVPCTVEVEYPMVPTQGMRGFFVGARPAAAGDLIAAAVEAARNADVAVVVVGTNDEWETEGEDRSSLALPGEQDELVAAVAAVNPRTVVVVNAGSPVTMPWLDRVGAVLQLWFPGAQLGEALADVLVGDAEPGGRLPVTFPRRLEDTPAFGVHPGDGVTAPYTEGLRIGYRWYESEGIEPLFPFGYGLGYTSFEMEPVGVHPTADGGAVVRVATTNVGERPGCDVLQVYVRPVGDHPEVGGFRRFAGSAKVSLVPGERRVVDIVLPPRRFESWLDGAWTRTGAMSVEVGRSAADTRPVGVVD